MAKQKTPEELHEEFLASWPSAPNPLNLIEGQNVMPGDPDGEPFIVQIVEPGCVRASALVFAKDEEHAKEILIAGIRESIDLADDQSPGHQSNRSQDKAFDNNRWIKVKRTRAKSILDCVDKGWVFATAFDKRVIGRISWSPSDTFI